MTNQRTTRPWPPAERRSERRYDAWFPVEVDGDELGNAVGVTRNASVRGLLVATNTRFAIGAPVTLMFRVSTDAPLQQVDATVLRVDRAPGELWPYRLAIEFDDPLAELEPSLRREAQQS